MTLLQQIEEIQYIENLTIKEFLKITGFSKVLYYSIKKGEKTELKPTQKKTLTDCFPKYSFDWSYSVESNKDIKKPQKTNLEEQINFLIRQELFNSDLENEIFSKVIQKINPILNQHKKDQQATQRDLLNVYRMLSEIKKELKGNNTKKLSNES